MSNAKKKDTNTLKASAQVIKASPAVNTKQTYASQFNTKYQTKTDTYISIEQRFKEMESSMKGLKQQLKQVGKEFKKRYGYQNYRNMLTDMVGLGEGPEEPLEALVINEIIQRDPSPLWVLTLTARFDPSFVQPVSIYQTEINQADIRSATNNDSTANGMVKAKVVWDGQHTALMLLALAVYGFGMKMADALKCTVPVNRHPGTDVAKMRHVFVALNNGQMRLELDKFDLYMQYVYAVRHNGSTNPDHVRMAQIQHFLEENDMFFTHEKFGDHTKPGAITRASEIFPNGKVDKFSVTTLNNAFKYHKMTNPSKPVEPLEMDNLCHIFRACEEQGIIVDNDYIKELAAAWRKPTNNTWANSRNASGLKHRKVYRAYSSWRNRQPNSELFGVRCNQTLVAPTWLCQTAALHGFPHGLPSFPASMNFEFTEQELK